MSEPFIGEIRIMPYTYAPRGWAWCDGQLLPISENTSLFSILGTTYGGDGRQNFALPNLKGRAPINQGQAPGLSYYRLGQKSGAESAQLHINNLPAHKHTANAIMNRANSDDPTDRLLSQDKGNNTYKTNPDPKNYVAMSVSALSISGGNEVHENRQPFLCVPFCIALDGLYPSRN